MTLDQLKKLQRNTSLLQKLLSDLGSASALKEFLRIIRRPGWTTPAEYRLVNGALTGMIGQARNLQGSLKSLSEGSRLVR